MLRQALYELEFEVEHCPEIFAAVERLTSRSFDVIVTDFDDGLEASFLLKTSRELKANSGAFTLAITSDRDLNAAARRVGADLVLNKPIVTEVAKYSLLTSDAFLRSMKNWLPKLQIPSGAAPNAAKASVQPVPVDPSRRANLPKGQPAHTSGKTGPPSKDYVRRPPALPARKSTEPLALWPYVSDSQSRGHHRSGGLVLIAAIAMVFLSVGYVFSEPTRSHSVVGSVAIVCEQALAKTTSWLRAPQDDDDSSSEWAQNQDPGSVSRKPSHIRVTEIHDPSEIQQPKPDLSMQLPQAEVENKPTQVARVTTVPIIPQSLRTAISPTNEVPSKASASLLAALQPVDLPEDFSSKLILQKVEPSYPSQALQAGLQGAVVLRAWIGKDGRIQDLKLMHGPFLLGQAAYQAVKQWRYKPYLMNGQAVEAQTYVTVDFKLP
jgi:TonB family protein